MDLNNRSLEALRNKFIAWVGRLERRPDADSYAMRGVLEVKSKSRCRQGMRLSETGTGDTEECREVDSKYSPTLTAVRESSSDALLPPVLLPRLMRLLLRGAEVGAGAGAGAAIARGERK